MKIAVLSDIHGNLGALRAVINDAQSKGVNEFYCLGDIIGYGAHPKKCLDVIREYCDIIILGNHEDIACNLEFWEPKISNELVIAGIRHALKQLTDDDISFLNKLSRKREIKNFGLTLAHASFSDPTWKYIEDHYTAMVEMRYLKTKLGFVGHTHVPVVYNMDLPNCSDSIWCSENINSDLESVANVAKCIINVGSVSQPRDRDSRASYGLLEFSADQVRYENIRVKYNIEQAAKDIRKAGLPERTASRLFEGR